MKRIKGYVVGYDMKAGELLWTIKVKDPESIHNNKKFEVASLHPGTMITKQGVDVTFRVQEFRIGRLEQEKGLKAVDVSLGSSEPSDAPDGGESIEFSMNLGFVREEGVTYAMCTGFETQSELEEWLCGSGSEGKVLSFLRVKQSDLSDPDGFNLGTDDVDAFGILCQMMTSDSFRRAFEGIATKIFKLG